MRDVKNVLLVWMYLMLMLGISSCSKTNKYQDIVDRMNKELPMELPGGITMDKSELDGDVFRYYYTFKEEPKDAVNDFLMATKEALIPMVKNQKELKVFRDDKMTIAFVYRKNDGTVVAEIKVTPKDYE